MQLSSGNKIVRNTIYLYFRMVLIMLVSLYTVRAVLNALGVVDYGIFSAIGGVVTSMSFLTLVLDNASQRFFSLELGKGKDGQLDSYFNSMLIVYGALSFLIIIIIELAGLWMIGNKMTIPAERMSAAYLVLHFSLAAFVVTILTNPFRALIMSNEHMDVYAYVSIFDAVAKLLIAFLLYKSPIDRLVFYSILIFVVTTISNVLYIFFSRKRVPLRVTFKCKKNIVSSIFKYSAWTLFGTISGVASIQGCNIVLNVFVGPIANAAFAIGTQVSNTIQQFSSSFFTAVRPPLTKSYAVGDALYMNKLFAFSNKTIFALTFMVVFPIFVNTSFILRLWLGKVSPYMVDFVRVMLIYALVLSLSNPITTIVQAAGRVKLYHTVVDGFALLVLSLLYLGLKMNIEVRYCILILVIVFFIAHILRLMVLRKVIEFSIRDYIISFAMPALFVTIACVIGAMLLGNVLSESLVSSITSLCICILLPLFFSGLFLFTKEERKQLLQMLKKKL